MITIVFILLIVFGNEPCEGANNELLKNTNKSYQGDDILYLGCVGGRYGLECENECNCEADCYCNDNLYGDGSCICGKTPTSSKSNQENTVSNTLQFNVSFINRFYNELQGDKDERNFQRKVYHSFWSKADPTPFKKPPFLIGFNQHVGKLLDIRPENKNQIENFILEYFSGSNIYKDFRPVAACYGGHQFGHWSEQLGDGRAILLAEIINSKNETYEIQIKGGGRTPYSRNGDGRAVMRSSIREYLVSEAMYSFRIPTTRALSIIGSEDVVFRDIKYNGNGKNEKTAIVTRIAPTFIRFGSFEILYYRKEYSMISELADFTIKYYFPELNNIESKSERYLMWFREVLKRTAEMVAQWQSVGFAHGVLNTDNMSILGLTVDYGPFRFLDEYKPDMVPNYSDHDHRYAFNQQVEIVYWNLDKLAMALSPIIDISNSKKELKEYHNIYQQKYLEIMKKKLGLLKEDSNDDRMISDLLDLMEMSEVDYTIFFRTFSSDLNLHSMFSESEKFQNWMKQYEFRFSKEGTSFEQRRILMNSVNPSIILRNYVLQDIIEKVESGNYDIMNSIMEVIRDPYQDVEQIKTKEIRKFTEIPPEWSKDLVVSCSS